MRHWRGGRFPRAAAGALMLRCASGTPHRVNGEVALLGAGFGPPRPPSSAGGHLQQDHMGLVTEAFPARLICAGGSVW